MGPSEDDLMSALRKADAAGDYDGARRIAGMLQTQRSQAAAAAADTRPAALKDWIRAHPETAASLQDLGSKMLSFAGGANDMLAGVPNLLVSGVTGDKLSDLSAAQEAAAAKHPVLHAAGSVAGLAGMAAVPATRLASATEGGVQGALQGYSQRGNMTDAALGAVSGAAVGAVVPPAVENIASTIMKQNGFKALAKIVARNSGKPLAQAAQDLATTMARDKVARGRMPTIQEALDAQSAQDVADLARGSKKSFRAGIQGAEDIAQQRQATMAAKIGSGGPAPATADIRRQAKAGFDNVMARIGDNRVPLSADEADLIVGGPEFKSLPAMTRRDIAKDFMDGGQSSLSVRSMEDIRNAASARGDGTGPEAANWRDFAKLVRQKTESAEPQYAKGLREFGGKMRQADTSEDLGLKSATNTDPTQHAGNARAAFAAAKDTETQQGVTEGLSGGARSKLISDVGTPEGAVNTAERLAGDANLHSNLRQALPPHEVDNLRELGKSETRSAENLGHLLGDRASEGDAFGNAAKVAATLTFHNRAYQAFTLAEKIKRADFKLPGTRLRAVDLALSQNPADHAAFINYLRSRGMTTNGANGVLGAMRLLAQREAAQQAARAVTAK